MAVMAALPLVLVGLPSLMIAGISGPLYPWVWNRDLAGDTSIGYDLRQQTSIE